MKSVRQHSEQAVPELLLLLVRQHNEQQAVPELLLLLVRQDNEQQAVPELLLLLVRQHNEQAVPEPLDEISSPAQRAGSSRAS